MPRLAFARLALLLTVLVGMLGCELSPPLQPLETGASPSPQAPTSTPGTVTPVSTASPTPSPTPAIRALRGYVVERNGDRLPGAKVSLGSQWVLTAAASASAVDELGQSVTLQAGEFILLNPAVGDQTLELTYDDASRSLSVTVQASGVTHADALYLPVFGAVPDGSGAVTATTATTMIEVQKASSSAPLVFSPDRITIQLKAPPNSAGDTIGAYAFTYVHTGDATISPTIVWDLPSVVVLPAMSSTLSGPTVDVSALIKNTSTSLQANWDFDTPNATLKVEFRRSQDGTPVLDRDGKPLVVRVNCLLVP